MRPCPRCGHDGGLGYCPSCHGGDTEPLARLFPKPQIKGTCSIVDDGTPDLEARVARLRQMGWHVTVWKGARRT